MPFNSAFKNTSLLWVLLVLACGGKPSSTGIQNEQENNTTYEVQQTAIVEGAQRTEEYLPLLRGKKVGIIANQTSVIFKSAPSDTLKYTHLVDSLLHLGVDIEKVFSPEHGFRGQADAGEAVEDGMDQKTKLPIVSLYGSQKKPSPEHLAGLDIVLFDIQDVGVRFYTYIATLQLVMEACAAENIPVVVLDRPNPNGHYVDGPTMESEHQGFLGLTPIPLVYGMTIGEYAVMINEEGWLEDGVKSDLTVIRLENYDHNKVYDLPIRPSPNLPNATAVNLYPSLGLFEGTNVNAGRGTDFQFQRFGAPFLDPGHYGFSYIPKSNFGAKHPKHKDAECYGEDLSKTDRLSEVDMQWLISAYENSTDKGLFFNTANFTRHAGTAKLQKKIQEGWTEEAIRKSWEKDLENFKQIRLKYLIYD